MEDTMILNSEKFEYYVSQERWEEVQELDTYEREREYARAIENHERCEVDIDDMIDTCWRSAIDNYGATEWHKDEEGNTIVTRVLEGSPSSWIHDYECFMIAIYAVQGK